MIGRDHRASVSVAKGRKSHALGAWSGFGVATIVFGVSKIFWLSLLALALTGMFDNISVVVRQTVMQMITPDAMRGRVSSITFVFISCSNELGELESGLTARWFGAINSVLLGGVGTILVVLGSTFVFPEIPWKARSSP